MIERECRRLAELGFPTAEMLRYTVQVKSIRHGCPFTPHLLWADQPSSRTVLLGAAWRRGRIETYL